MSWPSEIFSKLTAVVPRLWFVEPDEGGIRVTFGSRFQSTPPGWYFYLPLIHTFTKITVTPQIKDVRSQSVVTKDGVDICVGAAIRYQVKNASKAILKVQDYDEAIQAVVLGAVTSYVVAHTFEECRMIEEFEALLTISVVKASRGWGLEAVKVFITDLGTVRNLRIMSEGKSDHDIIMGSEE